MSSGSTGPNWDLTLYEVHRKPHDLITDESLIAVSPRALHAELMCPICLDLMRNTQTTKECLHRFCQECIITALRSGNKECPTCRKKLVSKRSLRSDPNFDALIAKIYPNRDELLQQERTQPMRPSLYHTHKRKRAVGETPPSSRGSTPQTMTTPLLTSIDKRPKLNATDADTESIVDSEDDQEVCITNVDIPKLEFQLRPHPDDEDVSNLIIRNLCTTPVTTVAHLVKFLQILEESSISAKFKLSAVVEEEGEEGEGSYVGLSQSVSLKQICDQYWSPGEKLKLYFSTDVSDSH